MPELRDARHLLEMAERAAVDGDFSSADDLLKEAARIQEGELGPLHPDLANTLNNLAIVAEKTGRTSDAETFYRRSAAILSGSLPADHPMVVESRKNLEDFCTEHGLPIAEATVLTPSAQDPAVTLEAPVPEPVAVPVPRAEEPVAIQPPPAAPRRSSGWLAWVAVASIVSIAAAMFVSRSWSSRAGATAAPQTAAASETAQPPAVAPAPAAPARPPAVEQSPAAPARPPAAEPRDGDRGGVTSARPAPAGDVSLVTAQLCATFSTAGGRWRCDPPDDPVARGAMVLYTRVKASRDATIEHRWYRDDTLRQAVKLSIAANPSEGYRTYSRQTINSAGNWRVEVRSPSGELLHEERFAVP